MLNKLNNILAKETKDESLKDVEEYAFIQSLTNIILNIKIPPKRYYHSHMRLQKSINHSICFLEQLNPRYAETLYYILNNNKINYDNISNNPLGISSVNIFNGDKLVNLIVRNNVEDSYTLTHETIHFNNFDINKITDNWNLMTEVFSILGESLQKEYFASLGDCPKDYDINEIDTIGALKIKAFQLDFEIRLILMYLEYGYINEYLCSELLNGYSEFYINTNCEHLANIVKQRELSFPLLQRYIIGGCLSAYMLERINNNHKYLYEFFELNDYCNEMEFIDTLKYLDLEVIDEDMILLSKKSLKDIEVSYAKKVKKLYK